MACQTPRNVPLQATQCLLWHITPPMLGSELANQPVSPTQLLLTAASALQEKTSLVTNISHFLFCKFQSCSVKLRCTVVWSDLNRF